MREEERKKKQKFCFFFVFYQTLGLIRFVSSPDCETNFLACSHQNNISLQAVVFFGVNWQGRHSAGDVAGQQIGCYPGYSGGEAACRVITRKHWYHRCFISLVLIEPMEHIQRSACEGIFTQAKVIQTWEPVNELLFFFSSHQTK